MNGDSWIILYTSPYPPRRITPVQFGARRALNAAEHELKMNINFNVPHPNFKRKKSILSIANGTPSGKLKRGNTDTRTKEFNGFNGHFLISTVGYS